LPLALLEAVRGLDRPAPDALDEYHDELSAKRLGLSRTVSLEIERLERLGARGRVTAGELAALLRLVARRHDAALVFSEAGRRAARLAARVLGLDLRRDGSAAHADPLSGRVPPESGSACTFYGSAVAELLRLLTDFDGAMVHVECRSRGDAACHWRSARLHS